MAPEPERGHDAARLEVRELRVGHRTVLVAAGEIELTTASVLEAAIERADASAAIELWIDLSAVEFMDSSGVRMLLDARSAFSRPPRRLAVICPPGAVRRLLAISGMDTRLAIHPDRAAAAAGS